MNRMGLAVLLCCVGIPGWAADKPAKPNIVLILCDDLGYECLGTDGCDSYKTPNLDKLAASGMRFDRAYAQPLCTPTRAQLMTGRYNVWNYTNFGTLDRGQTTFAQLLKSAGYATGIFGKWQLGREEDSPQHFGFETSRLWQHTRRPSRYPNPGLEFNGDEKDWTNGEYGPDIVQNEVLSFIDAHKAGPFCAYYPMILVHSPYVPTADSPEYDRKATDEGAGKNEKFFKDMVQHMDKHIGQLIANLEKNGLREKTLILFIGDNGTGAGTKTMFRGREYIGGKGKSTVPGMHVPFIASWPGVIPSGKVSSDLVDTTDFLPTLLEAAGVAAPAALGLDGHSLLPEMRGESGKPRTWTYSWHPTREREFAADRTFKLYADGRMVEYASDSHQEHPVADSTVAAAAKPALQAVLDRYANVRPAKWKALDGKGYQDGMPEQPPNRKARKKAA